MSKNLKIGLFGFGVVARAVYKNLGNTNINAEIKTIVVKNRDKKRDLPSHAFSYDKNAILSDPQIDLVLELTNDPEEAFLIVKSALKAGKNVVTASKKMVSENLEELISLQERTGSILLYEASAGGSIPAVRTLEEYFTAEKLQGLSGILNGSSNYILTRLENGTSEFESALNEARVAGFAETDSSLDTNGSDARHKLSILALHGFGSIIAPSQILSLGIESLGRADFQWAEEQGLKIKQVATAIHSESGLHLFVLPKLVAPSEPCFQVRDEFNGFTIQAEFAGTHFLSGKGAGGNPTASAVLSDIHAISRGHGYSYGKYYEHKGISASDDLLIEISTRHENPGVFAGLTEQSVVYKGELISRGFISLSELKSLKPKIEELGISVLFTGRTRSLIAITEEEEILSVQ